MNSAQFQEGTSPETISNQFSVHSRQTPNALPSSPLIDASMLDATTIWTRFASSVTSTLSATTTTSEDKTSNGIANLRQQVQRRKRRPRSQQISNSQSSQAFVKIHDKALNRHGDAQEFISIAEIPADNSLGAEAVFPLAQAYKPSAQHKLICTVCGEEAIGYNYDCISCESCKSFFRRNAFLELKCSSGCCCPVTMLTRRNCSACRFSKCIKAGMRREYILKDARYGIGVPKRDPPPRRQHQSTRPKRQYRKKTRTPALSLIATTSSVQEVNDPADHKVSKLSTSSGWMSTREHSANPSTIPAAFTSDQTNHTHSIPTRIPINGSKRDNGIIGHRNLHEILVGSCDPQAGRSVCMYSSTSYRDTSPPSASSSVSTVSNSRAINSGGLGAPSEDRAFLLHNHIPQIGGPPPAFSVGLSAGYRTIPINGLGIEGEASAICMKCDPNARQTADQTLVFHSLIVEPSLDPRFDLLITAESRCSSVARSIAVSVPRLARGECLSMLDSLCAAILATRRPLTPDEAATLPRRFRDPYESFAYMEHGLRKLVQSLRLLPDFRMLPINDQIDIVKAASSAIFRLLLVFHCDSQRMAFIHPVGAEWVAGHPDDVERVCSFIDVTNIELCNGRFDTTAVLINIVNFTLGIHIHCGNDELLSYLIVLLVIFSPHRFLADPRLLATVTPLHAKYIEFLRLYLEGSYWRGSTYSTNTDSAVAASNDGLSNAFSYSINHAEHTGGWRVCHRRPPVTTITPDLEACTMIGIHLPGLAALTREQRDHLRSLIVDLRIHDQVDYTMLEKFSLRVPLLSNLNSNRSSACENTNMKIETDWRWKFAFCVAALNDHRMSEVTLRDQEVRWALSQQYTPLINELLATISPSQQ